MESWRDILRQEFDAEDGSFLIKIRREFLWDDEAFSRLTDAMESCCRSSGGSDVLERWVANGFWYVSWFVKQWTTHPNSPQAHAKEHYDKAYQQLECLAYWYFTGQSPHLDGHGCGQI